MVACFLFIFPPFLEVDISVPSASDPNESYKAITILMRSIAVNNIFSQDLDPSGAKTLGTL